MIHPKNTYNHMEMIWVGDFNPKMMKVASGVGGKIIKTYYTMRKQFDPNREFKRAEMMN